MTSSLVISAMLITQITVGLLFTLSGVFSFSYVTSLIRLVTHQPIYIWKAYEII